MNQWVILASGPSLCEEDVQAVKDVWPRFNVMTVNSTYRIYPGADIHYSSDHDWWAEHLPEMRKSCIGEFWTGYPFGRVADDVHVMPYDKKGRGISTKPGVINWGGNSGYCALGLAYQMGAKKIILLGFDMCDPHGKEHWHGSHSAAIKKPFNFPMWVPRFGEAAKDFERLGVEVINCSRVTALRCFERKPLSEALC